MHCLETVHYTSNGPEATFHHPKRGNDNVFLSEHILNSEEQNNWNFHHFGSLKLKSKTLMPVTSTNVTAENHLNLLVCQ